MDYLEKEKFKGRVITKKGEETIETINVIDKIDFHKKKLEKYTNTKVLEDFLMVFETRKSIENTTTHLVAENITPAEIVKIEEIIEIQENNYRMHKSITQNDLDFHNTIVRASRIKF